jgi:hypothetical protein
MALDEWPHATPLFFGLFGPWQQLSLGRRVDANITTDEETTVLSMLTLKVPRALSIILEATDNSRGISS